jgi:inhibitor of KinA
MTVRLLDAGDAAFTIEFGNAIDPLLLAQVNALDAAIQQRQAAGALPGLIETVPTFRSLTVLYDPLLTNRATLQRAVTGLLAEGAPPGAGAGRGWRLPVCYEGDCAPDLEATAQALGMASETLVQLHSDTEYRVYMMGFMPGFPFMGDLPQGLHLARRSEPRLRVPAGSVAIATGLTAIYPWESPGGWHLLGRCPLRLFDLRRSNPALLAAGDRVRFVPVGTAEYARLAAAQQAGEALPAAWQPVALPADPAA